MNRIIVLLILMGPFVFIYSQKTAWLRTNPENCADATIRTDFPDNPYWGDDDNIICNAFTAQGNFFIQRSLIRFELSSVPSNAQIISAKLSLWCNIESGHHQLQYGDNQSYLSRIIQPWEEQTVTWNNQPVATKENQVWLHVSQSRTEDYLDIDVTNLIKDFIELKNPNYGLMMQLLTEEMYRTLLFASSDFSDTSKRPLLVITYVDCESSISDFNSIITDNTVQFENNSSNSTDWYWDFGDGYYSTLENPEHTYSNSGIYNVCLMTSNDCSSDTICEQVSTCPDLNAGFSYEISERPQIQFLDTSFNANSWFWNFGDGFYSDLQHPLHQFNTNGVFNVCLIVSNDCETDTICQLIDLQYFGISDSKISELFIISPNPTSGPISISYPVTTILESITIYSLDGKEILKLNNKNQEGKIKIPYLGKGLFFIKFFTQEGIVIKKLISD